jgi:hypothetical protein
MKTSQKGLADILNYIRTKSWETSAKEEGRTAGRPSYIHGGVRKETNEPGCLVGAWPDSWSLRSGSGALPLVMTGLGRKPQST